MEPMLVFAVGIVVYCGYLTVQDLIADFRREGLTSVTLHGRGVASGWLRDATRFLTAKTVPQQSRRSSATFIPKAQRPFSRQHNPVVTSRVFRPHLG